jgi:hypothetical protein
MAHQTSKTGRQWTKRPPVTGANGRLTNKIELNGEKVHAAGVFVLEWYEGSKRCYRALTEDPDDAAQQLRTQQAKLEGVDVVEKTPTGSKVALRKAIEEFLEETKLNKAKKTFLAYKRALDLLLASSKCEFVSDVGMVDVASGTERRRGARASISSRP